MDSELSLSRLADSISPSRRVEARIKERMRSRLTTEHLLAQAREALTPPAHVHASIWGRIAARLIRWASPSFLERLRTFLTPSEDLALLIKRRVFLQLEAVPVPSGRQRAFKWIAAFTVLFLVARITPVLFLPPTTAKSVVTIVPEGNVAVLIGGLWQPLAGRRTLTRSALIQTQNGTATILYHDEAVIRLASHTTVALHDVSRRDLSSHDPIFTFHSGELWVEGIVPSALPGLTIQTSQGNLSVHEGSLSLKESKGILDLTVWDRNATIARVGSDIPLVAGERVALWQDNIPLVKKIPTEEYDEPWVAENLRYDAMHRGEIAQIQQERRASLAGILPTSPLYVVKRAVEKVDVMLTLGEEARAEKLLDQAGTRLNEAAALLTEGSTEDANGSLREYRSTLLAVATGSGGDSVVQSLIQKKIQEAVSDVGAALPTDEAYVLKKTVLETAVAVPESGIESADVKSQEILDTLAAVQRDVTVDGDLAGAKETLNDLKPSLSSLDASETASPQLRKEVEASLTAVAAALGEGADSGTGQEILQEVSQYLPSTPEPRVEPLTEAQIASLVDRVLRRVFVYKSPVGQDNQLEQEMIALRGNPDRGRILRHLLRELTDMGQLTLAQHVRAEIQYVRDANR